MAQNELMLFGAGASLIIINLIINVIRLNLTQLSIYLDNAINRNDRLNGINRKYISIKQRDLSHFIIRY